jgi:hypothetical protein
MVILAILANLVNPQKVLTILWPVGGFKHFVDRHFSKGSL